ncbi:PadR family transcriptional regulator [Fodinicola acaciae]|uniref:PadR family transcriptional regulator n=1 Tax=Fodinicola acaciae TaxID=2681555 RepID=UPI0013CF5911|nr:PadR family transcriptional regulator [Fodinicola acaciae]
MADRKISNPLALAVLGLLFERPMHPYDMVTTLRHREKHDSINIKYGSLYTVVRALEREKFIVGTETVRAGRYPERTLYAITDAGKQEFHDWLAELLGTPHQEFPRFLAGLSMMPGLPPDEAADLLEKRADRLAEQVAGLRATITDKPADMWDVFLVENEYRIAVFTAEIDWIRELVRRIRTDELSGIAELREMHRRLRE